MAGARQARDILLAIYLANLVGSVGLFAGVLLNPAAAPAPWLSGAVVTLLGVQIVYRVLTAFLVKLALGKPVVLSNLVIAAVHALRSSVFFQCSCRDADARAVSAHHPVLFIRGERMPEGHPQWTNQ